MLQNFWPLIKDRIKLLGSDNQCDAKKRNYFTCVWLARFLHFSCGLFNAIGGVQAPPNYINL